MERIKITKAGIEADLESGLKRKQIAEKYGVPQTHVTKLINKLGLTGKRASNFRFEIVEEAPEAAVAVNEPTMEEFIPVDELMSEGVSN